MNDVVDDLMSRIEEVSPASKRAVEAALTQMEQGIHDALHGMNNLREKMDPIVARVKANVLGVSSDICWNCKEPLDMDLEVCLACGKGNPDVSQVQDCKGEPL